MKKVLVFRHVPHETLGTLESFINSRDLNIEYCDLFRNSPFPNDPNDYQLIISMGGPMNADETDRYPFLARERSFLKNAIHLGKSVFGICLGSQIIARALDAKVYSGPKKEIGWYPVVLTTEGQNDPVLASCGMKSTVFHWHGDTFDIPAGASRLASSDLYPNQAFRFNRNVYAFQFHIEITPEIISLWAEENKDELRSLTPVTSKDQLMQDSQKYMNSLTRITDKIYPALHSNLIN